MPSCVNQGVRTHYHLEGNPDGPPIALVHGFDLSLMDWYEAGYVAALGGACRLVLVDLRGHGGATSPTTPTPTAGT